MTSLRDSTTKTIQTGLGEFENYTYESEVIRPKKYCNRHREIELNQRGYCVICAYVSILKADISEIKSDIEDFINRNIPALYRNKPYINNHKIQDIPDSIKSVLVCGKNGTGKTHYAIDYLLKKAVSVKLTRGKAGYLKYKTSISGKYTDAIKIVRAVKDNWTTKSYTEQEILDRYITPEYLVVDEIGVQFGSATEKQYLTEIINDRYSQQKTTVLVGNLTPKEIKDQYGDRIYSRFQENGKVLVFNWDSYRGRK